MTLQQLKYVITISKSGSMHTAADELFITQPNLCLLYTSDAADE